MRVDRFFLDTAYALAILNPRDRYHPVARGLFPHVREAREAWTTEAVLAEVGNVLARADRSRAVTFVQGCYDAANIRVVSIERSLFRRAIDLYAQRSDKTWGLTDCLSFIVMQDQSLTDALTADVHFEQAGFRALLASGST